MADVHYFRSPFLRSELKRVRKDNDDDDEDEEEQSSDDRGQKQNQASDDGKLDEAPDELPLNFPHAPLSTKDLGTVSHRNKIKTVKRRHIAILTTILHKCMLDGDYVRAGRAFSMLLRLEMRGSKIDVRKDGLWGIGAEILLRRDFSSVEDTATKPTWFSQEGFRAARAYYDRLILQYPHRRTHPHLVSSIHFNVAMFGIWVFQIQDRSQSLLQSLENGSSMDEILTALGISSPEDDDSTAPDMYQSIKESELEQARAIQNHIEHVTLNPPFDKDPQHHKLLGMISLWIADILKALSKSTGEIAIELKKAASQFRLCANNGGIVWKEAELAAQPAPEVEPEDEQEEEVEEEKKRRADHEEESDY